MVKIKKKGVSPLIATVLLVMIVVSIGAAVMVLIQGLTQENIDTAENQKMVLKCSSEVSLSPVTLGNKFRICINNSDFTLTLENKGMQDVSDFKLVVFADDILTIDGKTNGIEKGSYQTLRYNLSSINNYSKIDKIKLYPKIPGGPRSQVIACDLPNLEWTREQIKYFSNCSSSSVTWDDNIAIISN